MYNYTMSIVHFIGKVVGAVGLFFMSFSGSPAPAAPMVGSTIPQIPAFTQDSLASGIGKTDVTMTLVTGTDSQGRSLSGYYGFVVDEGSSNQEIVACTAAGTALTACVRGLDTVTGTTSTVALEQIHRRGASVKVTNAPFDLVVSNIIQGKDGFPTLMHYDTSGLCTISSSGASICDKSYTDGQVVAGAAAGNTSTAGIFMLSTALQGASSTGTGIFNAVTYNRVVGSANATSSPKVGCDGTSTKGALCVPVAQNNGTLDPNFIATSSSNTYNYGATINLQGTTTETGAGGLLVTASTTLTGTTSISASNLNTNPLKLNGVSYAFSGSQGASSTVLATNGSGFLTWETPTTTLAVGLQATSSSFGSIFTGANIAVTTGFTPAMIRINYILVGHTNSGSSNVITTEKGTAVYIGTTLVYNNILYNNTSGTLAAADFNSTNGPVNSTSAPASGDQTVSNAASYASLSVASVTSTGFNFLCTYGGFNGSTQPASCTTSWEAIR